MPEVIVNERRIDQQHNNKVVVDKILYKMTGYSKFSLEGVSRIHNYTNHILLTTLNSLLYFFVSFGWINEEECTKAFDKRSANQMR
jgi:hypothetical protein